VNRIAPGDRSANLSATSLVVACAGLVALLTIAGCGLGAVAYYRSGPTGILAAAIACGICMATGCLALAIGFYGQKLGQGAQGVLAAMLVRMGVPLVSGIALQRLSPPLAEAGVFPLVLGNYLFMLVVETALSLRFVPTSAKQAAKAA
jgi:hypothetical protein